MKVAGIARTRYISLYGNGKLFNKDYGFISNGRVITKWRGVKSESLKSIGQQYVPYQHHANSSYQVPVTTNQYQTPQTNVYPQQYSYGNNDYHGAYYNNQYSPRRSYSRYNNSSRRYNYGYQGRNYSSSYQQPPPVQWHAKKLVEIKKDFYDLSPEADSRSGEEIEKILKSHEIIIDGEYPLPKPVNSFDEAVFNEEIQQLIKISGFVEPTPIQKVGWTCCLTGRDVIGVSRTGSGKTLAYLLPGILHAIAQPQVEPGEGPIVLILAPTRELCQQINREAQRYVSAVGLRGVVVYGGVDKYQQQQQIAEGLEIMVATPGRLLDLLTMGAVKLDRVSYLVLDEADRMLDMGFEPQIRSIYSQVRPDRQTMMFSATLPKNIRNLAKDFCKSDCIYIQVGNLELTANPNIKQNVSIVDPSQLNKNVVDFLQSHQGKKTLVFCDTRMNCDHLVNELAYRRIGAVALHGGKTQTYRTRVIHQFRSQPGGILVATDVASRGLDIPDVEWVVNVDAPKNLEDYIHRIGRTGRGNSTGNSILFMARHPQDEIRMRFASQLVKLLQDSRQAVPPELESMAQY
ncbi:bifunctional P-loop containing nucleoside triphosphate hydrolase/Helicase [Babesia duncani]|uniref:RNA helicase n=1 Tax=Babesia duncani TaxID=323732 RepID=A0AAD9PJH6_9APIC|nr:bifunctional P-loop containing nucleoside triphosphate hydrolase/Helicase [Babesia duncani]